MRKVLLLSFGFVNGTRENECISGVALVLEQVKVFRVSNFSSPPPQDYSSAPWTASNPYWKSLFLNNVKPSATRGSVRFHNKGSGWGMNAVFLDLDVLLKVFVCVL